MNQDTDQKAESAPPRSGFLSPRLMEMVKPIWKRRKFVAVCSLGSAVVALLVTLFILPPYYKSTATLLPESDKSKLSTLGSLAGLADLAGSVSPVGGGPAKLYPFIVSSDTLLTTIINRKYATQKYSDSVDLIHYYGYDDLPAAKAMDKCLRRLRGNLETSVDLKSGVFKISLEIEEPQLCADITNAIVRELDRFMRFKRMSSASDQVRWVSQRLVEAERDLKVAEDGLKVFLEKNRRIDDSPELVIQNSRHQRDVEINTALLVELKKQYELARIEEIRNIPIINVLDAAQPAVRKEGPHGSINSIIGFLLGFLLSSAYVAYWPVYKRKFTQVYAEVAA